MLLGPALSVCSPLGLPEIPLVEPRFVDARRTFARAQTGGVKSIRWRSDGVAEEMGADQLRFDSPGVGIANWLRLEGQRPNGVRNPRGEGAASGAPGTFPTYWNTQTVPAGVTREIELLGEVGGVNLIRLRWVGTPSATTALYLLFDTATAWSVAQGSVATASLFIGLASPLIGVVNPRIGFDVRNSGGGYLTNLTDTVVVSSSVSRYAITKTLSDVGTAAAGVVVQVGGVQIGVPIDINLIIGWPQIELGAFASTPKLPPIGSPSAAVVGADLLSWSLQALGIRDTGACTLLWAGMLPQAAPSSVNQMLWSMDDGTASNRVAARNAGGSSTITGARVTSGAAGASLSAGSITAGTPFRCGATYADGVLSVSVDGAAPVAVIGGPTSGLTTLRLGMDTAGTSNLFGLNRSLRILPYAVTDAELRARVAAMTLS